MHDSDEDDEAVHTMSYGDVMSYTDGDGDAKMHR